MKFLICGLGNMGPAYVNTRHNIGMIVLDHLASQMNAKFSSKRFGDIAEIRHRGNSYYLLKPTTMMNNSGRAIRYWLNRKKIEIHNMLVITDDVNIEFGRLRLRNKGSDGGHNGLKSIQEYLGSIDYPRLRFGIGSNFSKGYQVDFVLGEWHKEEALQITSKIELASEIILNFGIEGIDRTMNKFNN